MTRWVERILARYGQEVTVERDGTAEAVRAFLQPVTERSEDGPEPSAVGRLDGRLCQYIGGWLSHWRAVLERAREAELRS